MIQAARGSPNAFVYKPGDLVKVATRVLEPHASVKQVTKLQPKYLGPFEVLELVGALVRVSLPDAFRPVHDVFSVHDIRPWLSVQQDFESTLPSSRKSAQDPVVSVLDRRQAPGRLPERIHSLLSIQLSILLFAKVAKLSGCIRESQNASHSVLPPLRYHCRFPMMDEVTSKQTIQFSPLNGGQHSTFLQEQN
jgi:hypothetical protein